MSGYTDGMSGIDAGDDVRIDEINRQLNVSSAIPDFDDHTALWTQSSESYREHWPDAHMGVRYGANDNCTMDLFRNSYSTSELQPVVVFFHGGYWRRFSGRDFSFVARPLNAVGAMVAVVDYPLVPRVSFAGLIESCIEAVSWVVRSIEQYGGDPEYVLLLGHSAGAHIGAVLANHDWEDPAVPASLKMMMGISGLYDLQPVQASFLNETLQLTCQDVERYSPSQGSVSPIPTVLAVGGLETDIFREQAVQFAASRTSAGCPTDVVVLDGLNHMQTLTELPQRGPELVARLGLPWPC